MNHVIDRLKEVFEITIESGIKYEGSLENPDYYGLFCKAASKEQLYKLMGNNLCMFNCEVDGDDAVMMLFSIPINTSEESGAKNVAERVMEVVQNVEECFVTLDELDSKQVQEDKFVYVTAIKKLEGNKE
jgi:hypothetical protein